MAPCAKQLTSFVLFMCLFASLHVEGRQVKFFSSVMLSNSEEKSNFPMLESPIASPAPEPISGDDNGFAPIPFESGIGFSPAPAPAPAVVESDNPYGLYGANGDDKESEINPDEDFSSNNDEEFNNQRLTQINSDEPINNYNNNGNSNNYYNNNNNGYSNGYNGIGSSEKQGMSDTRFLENGKYYYDTNNENYNNQNQNEAEKGSNGNEGYYGEKSKYEFDSMEEYERQTQRGYVP